MIQSPPIRVFSAIIESWILQLKIKIKILVTNLYITHDDRPENLNLFSYYAVILDDWPGYFWIWTDRRRFHDQWTFVLVRLRIKTVLVRHKQVLLFSASQNAIEIYCLVSFLVAYLLDEGVLLNEQSENVQWLLAPVLIQVKQPFVCLILYQALNQPRLNIVHLRGIQVLNNLNWI